MRRLFTYYILLMLSFEMSLSASEDLYERLSYYSPKIDYAEYTDDFDPFQLELLKQVRDNENEQKLGILQEKVFGAIGGDHIKGVIYGRGSVSSRILIDDWVFGPVDEIQLLNASGKWVSPLSGYSLLILGIESEILRLRVSPDDGSSFQEISIPLNFDLES